MPLVDDFKYFMEAFIKQSLSNYRQPTKPYNLTLLRPRLYDPKQYKSLTIRDNPGARGYVAEPTSLAFWDNSVTNASFGLYPTYLYYKKQDVLILAYGYGDKVKLINSNWKSQSSIDSVLEIGTKYGNSFVYKQYDNVSTSYQSWDYGKMLNELDALLDKYFQYLGTASPYPTAETNAFQFQIPPVINGGPVTISKSGSTKAANKSNKKLVAASKTAVKTSPAVIPLDDFLPEIVKRINATNLIYDDMLIKRLAVSLIAKPFVILSGLSGSGKTQLAKVFAECMCDKGEWDKQICIVPVGADWTNRENLLGYVNGLNPSEYVVPDNGALRLILEASKKENKEKPYFLILDEMNLSHVERYFSDFLSSIESGEKITLWSNTAAASGVTKTDQSTGDTIPPYVEFPKNLYIIGTMNVDETTYMFSPKVLDRANVIEFTVSDEDLDDFLKDPKPIKGIDPEKDLGVTLLQESENAATYAFSSTGSTLSGIDGILMNFFKQLKSVNAEFAFRTASEMYKFIAEFKALDSTIDNDVIVDAAIVQKLLPKVHGSFDKLKDALKAMWNLCEPKQNGIEVKDPSKVIDPSTFDAKYKLSADKIKEMYNCADKNGYASFAEA